jgi:hypothetical protein
MDSMKTLRLLFVLCILALSVNAQRLFELPQTWKFKLDSTNIGIKEHWYAKDLDDSHWADIKVGELWESQGYDYDGYAWYRLKLKLPEDWGSDKVILIFGGVDDINDVYLNGKFVGSQGDLEKHITVYSTFTSTDLTSFINRSGDNLLAVRVYDWGGGGGIWKPPIAIVSDDKPFRPGGELVREAAKQNPEWALPRWAKGTALAWTMVGMENGVHEVLRSIDGFFGSTAWPFTISMWLFDSLTKKLYAPENLSVSDCQATLKNGYLPVSVFSFPAGDLRLESHLFVNSEGDVDADAVAYCRIMVQSAKPSPEGLKLIVAIRPYRVNTGTGVVKSIEYDQASSSITVNDSLSVLLDDQPERFFSAAVSKDGDISALLLKGEQRTETKMYDPVGMASGAVVIPVNLSDSEQIWKTGIRIPLAPRKSKADFEKIRAFSIREQEEKVTQRWEKRLRSFGMNLHLPNREYENAYYASLAYILISMDKGMLHPGPLAYDYFWYRDGAYMTNALLQAGFSDLIKPILQVFMKPQLPTGEFPSIFDLNYRGFGPHEWDAQGQAIFALAQHYRYTHDKDFVKQFSTNVEKAVDFIKATRAGHLQPAHQGTAVYGILPPSTSAEDLGPGEWHHYWDDFWCIKGLRDAAYLAGELGEQEKEQEFLREGDELLNWTQHSYSKLMKDSSIDWIPNGPEDIHGTSMARGTGPAVWPGQILSASDRAVQISFQRYFEKWIEPYGGAYLHQGKFWPYAFELAECYTLLGRREIASEIFDWHLNHQTFPGAYSWAEQIDTTSLWFAAGDMPHCWVAADYMNALRASLLYEDENRIVLGAGIPLEWIGPGKELSIDSAPTFFGELSYAVECSKNGKQISIRLNGTARPPGGYIVRFPLKREAIEGVTADGAQVSVMENGDVVLKAGVREITFTLK